MANLTQQENVRAQSGISFSRRQVYMMLREFVYPPCRLEPDEIRMHHNLASDLGYAGNSKRLLAPKANNTFSLQAPNRFTGPEMTGLSTVEEHYRETCAKLSNAGRLST